MTEQIAPTAIDALVHIESVRVVGRHRYALGNLDELAKSIADVGLLNPITLTRDCRLVAGQRRLEACRRLGWVEVPARFVDSLDDAAKLLRAERDENTCRKEMLLSELASLGEALYALEAEAAKERQGTRTDLQSELLVTDNQKFEGVPVRARDKVGAALGMSGVSYHHLRKVYKAAIDPETPEGERVLARAALDKMDRTNTIQPAAIEFARQVRAKRETQEVVAAVTKPEPDPAPIKHVDRAEDPNWIPDRGDNGRKAVARRRELIRQLAGQGHSSEQIGDRIGVLEGTVRQIAREEGITIRADEAFGRRRRRIDSNRIVRETIATLDGLHMGLGLVNYAELDPAEIESWATSLGDSIRVLTGMKKQLANRMKEMTL